MKIKILNVNYHRNGSGACDGFMAVLFEAKTEATGTFIATFPTNEHGEMEFEQLRIVNTANFDSKWGGDHFVTPLHDALPKYCKGYSTKEVSWTAAAFPTQYQKEPAKHQ